MKKIIYYLFVVIFVQVSAMVWGAIPAKERAALIDLYNSTNGDKWEQKGINWKTPPLEADGFSKIGTEKDWWGLGVSGDHVIGLTLVNLGLDGVIPSSIGDLEYLQSLRMQQNRLRGELPSQLGKLVHLRDIHIFSNRLSGRIPAELGKLTEMQSISLEGNQLSGAIPEEIGNLKSLIYLNLNANELEGNIPTALSKLTRLQVLILNSNQLTGTLPSGLGNLSELLVMEIEYNQLSGTIPVELGALSKLSSFYLTRNRLTGSIPRELGNLEALNILSLGENELSGSIPPELGNLTGLTSLSLDHNKLTGEIPPGLGNLTNLVSLSLNNNELSGSISRELGNLENLWDLNLKNNALNGSIPPELGKLSRLSYLDLWNNQLSGPIPPELGKLHGLGTLSLGNNRLTGSIPVEFSGLTDLITLDLSNNQLSGLLPRELGMLSRLYSLRLNNNNFEGLIPMELGNLNYLNILVLNNNRFNGRLSFLSKMAHLNELRLSYNNFDGPIPEHWENLKYINILALDNNQLEDSIPSELGNLSNLAILQLNNNQLTGKIPGGFGNLTNLKYLALSHNMLSGTIPQELGKPGELTDLYLEYNQLSGSIPAQLGNLSKLERLNLGANQLGGSIPSELEKLTKLQWLLLDHNRLNGVIPPGLANLANVTSLDISYNCLSATDAILRNWLGSLQPAWEANQDECKGKTGGIVLSRAQLMFEVVIPDGITMSRTVQITNSGTGTLNWTAAGNASWLSLSPGSGIGDGVLTVSIKTSGLTKGEYNGTITVSDPNAYNSPRTISVLLSVRDRENSSLPFGEISTPVEGGVVSNSIAVTGWALDNLGVTNVKIYNGEDYIGDAAFINGARPDIEQLYPNFPDSKRAGWGYILLTQTLPNGGNGVYILTAKAFDKEGYEVVLGSKTITIDNANSVKPFGAIDTPGQGEWVLGNQYINSGWVLTPQPNSIPGSGASIDVVIDGVVQGHPVYGVYRSDIAALFPNYENANQAGGYFYFDPTKYKYGYHTISWNVTDSAGNSDGIGSRYFWLGYSYPTSSSTSGESDTHKSLSVFLQEEGINSLEEAGEERFEINEMERVSLSLPKLFEKYTEFHQPDQKLLLEQPVNNEAMQDDSRQLSSLHNSQFTLHTSSPAASNLITGFMIVGDQLRNLPIGSTLDSSSGTFYWQPGPGFIGEYRFLFVLKDESGQSVMKNLVIDIKPKQD